MVCPARWLHRLKVSLILSKTATSTRKVSFNAIGRYCRAVWCTAGIRKFDSLEKYWWMLDVTFWPFLNLNSHWNGHNWWIQTIRLMDSRGSYYQKRICSTYFVGVRCLHSLKKKSCAIATPAQEIWLADDVILPTPVFGWYAAHHWILPLHP